MANTKLRAQAYEPTDPGEDQAGGHEAHQPSEDQPKGEGPQLPDTTPEKYSQGEQGSTDANEDDDDSQN